MPGRKCNQSEIRQLLSLILTCTLISAFILWTFRFQIILGSSMEPTFNEGSVIICMRTYSAPEPQDVVLFRTSNGVYLLKRVIAVGGQKVRVDNTTGEVWIDGVLQTDGFCAPRDLDYAVETWPGGYTGKEVQIPKGYLFCMGDNRANSLDSRDSEVGLVSIQSVWGKAVYPSGN